ncbi:hypothetical protein V6N13_029857 [Hibiscus sabdariffa]|uniref:Uncharacterized protein n=2 Tax=Hibiscus sabdariffa TaxID=183260 RepID=A0ABR2ALT6_9ROSI
MPDAHISNLVPVSALSQPGDSGVPTTSDADVVEQPAANSSMHGDIVEIPSLHVLEHTDSTVALVDNKDEALDDNTDELPAACNDSPKTVAGPSQAENNNAPPTLNQ